MKVDRKQFCGAVECAGRGAIDPKFTKGHALVAFKDGHVSGWSGNIFVSAPLPEGAEEIEGTFLLDELLKVLKKMTAESLDITVSKEEIVLSSGRRKSGIRRMEIDPLDIEEKVDKSKFANLDPEKFGRGLKLCWPNCSMDYSQFVFTLIHITSSVMEACNNRQAIRVKTTHTKKARAMLKEPLLIPAASARVIYDAKPDKIFVGKHWVMFVQTASGILYAVPKYKQEYKDLDRVFGNVEGEPFVFPKGMTSALDCASIFAESRAQITIADGKVTLRGEGESGWYEETRRVSGSPSHSVSFRAHVDALKECVAKANTCTITESILCVTSDDFEYAIALTKG